MKKFQKNFSVLSIFMGHEANASIMKNGELVASASEERFNKKKCYVGYPRKAIDFCIRFSKLSPKNLDEIVIVSKKLNIDQIIVKRNSSFSIKDFLREQEEYWYPIIYENKQRDYLEVFKDKIIKDRDFNFSKFLRNRKNLNKFKAFNEICLETIINHLRVKRDKIYHIDHEKGHQFYGLYAAPEKFRKKCLVLTNEGMGDYSNLTVSKVKNGMLQEIFSTKKNRIGTLYKMITLLLGMKVSQHEYKVMGLAPYASEYEINKAYKVAFKNLFKVKGYGIFLKKKPKDFFFHFKKKLADCRFDGIAGALQKTVEETLVEWIKSCIKKSKVNSVILSGGVAQNIKAAIPISNIKGLKSFHLNPSSGDSTLSIGGCYYASNLRKDLKIKNLNNIYLGPSYSKKDIKIEITKLMKDKKIVVKKIKDNKIVVKKLIEGKILGRFSGRMEFGQRALGNRSIIADPRNYEVVKKINDQIKFRDFWMPFTPSMLKKHSKKYIVNKKKLDCPYMTKAFNTTFHFKNIAPATIHPADLTTRPQLLEKKHNPGYYNLIEEFGKKTNVYCLLNTSLNLHGYPMVCSPKDAIFTFNNSNLDGLILEDYLILRR